MRYLLAVFMSASTTFVFGGCGTGDDLVTKSGSELYQHYLSNCVRRSPVLKLDQVDGGSGFYKFNMVLPGDGDDISEEEGAKAYRAILSSRMEKSLSEGKYDRALETAIEEDEFVDAIDSLGGGVIGTGNDLADAVDRIGATLTREYFRNFAVATIINFKDEGDIKNASITAPVTGLLNNTATGIIKVDRDQDKKVGLGFEAHRIMFDWRSIDEGSKKVNWALGIGPYVSLMLGDEDFVDVLGLGITLAIVGMPDYQKKDSRSALNLSIGYFLDFDSLRLEENFEEGKPLPEGETEVELEEYTDEGPQFMISFSLSFN